LVTAKISRFMSLIRGVFGIIVCQSINIIFVASGRVPVSGAWYGVTGSRRKVTLFKKIIPAYITQ